MKLLASLVAILCVGLVEINAGSVPAQEGKHWALIVAGSNGYYNYRHQADACHAYQILHKHGIPDERIVVMMYDDIANNSANPVPGTIINHPDGVDVYAGVPKDYVGKDVTPDNFLNILSGNANAMQGIGSGKVIASGPNDHVFVNFVDHGAPGLIAFPSEELYADHLLTTLTSMSSNQQFKQMLIYLEACESGSMFKNLSNNLNIYATTAANGKESSYAIYYDKLRRTYLGDVYSVKWMEDSDIENLNKESIRDQFKIVKQETNTSHVEEFGDLRISLETVGLFQGLNDHVEPVAHRKMPSFGVQSDAVPSEDVPLAILKHRLADASSRQEALRLRREINLLNQRNNAIRKSMANIVSSAADSNSDVGSLMTSRHDITDYECYRTAVKAYNTHCWDIHTHDAALRELHKLVNLCENGLPISTIVRSIEDVCSMVIY